MASVEDVLNKAKDVADAVGKKTEELVEIGKMKMEISRLEKEISIIMEGLGRLMYNNREEKADITEQTTACMEQADELNARVAELRNKVAACQHQLRCPQCGSMNTQDSDYCKKCGERL